MPPDTIDDAYASLSATLPGIDCRPSKYQGPSKRRQPAEPRAVRQIAASIPRTLAPDPDDQLGPVQRLPQHGQVYAGEDPV